MQVLFGEASARHGYVGSTSTFLNWQQPTKTDDWSIGVTTQQCPGESENFR